MILNGVSSAGKTTLIRAFVEDRAAVGDCWIHVALDDFIAKLPRQWIGVTEWPGLFANEGLSFALDGDGLVVRVGEVGRRLLAAYQHAVAAWARSGFDVIVDEVAFDQEAAHDWDDALVGLSVTWGGLRCDPEVAAARELARGDRLPGLARGQSAVVHQHVAYDFELDSTSATPAALCSELVVLLCASP